MYTKSNYNEDYIGLCAWSLEERTENQNGWNNLHSLSRPIEIGHKEVSESDFRIIWQGYCHHKAIRKLFEGFLIKNKKLSLNNQDKSTPCQLFNKGNCFVTLIWIIIRQRDLQFFFFINMLRAAVIITLSRTTRMVKSNQDIIGEQYMRNDDDSLVVTDKAKKIVWSSNHEKLWTAEFAWGTTSLFQADAVRCVLHLKDKDMV